MPFKISALNDYVEREPLSAYYEQCKEAKMKIISWNVNGIRAVEKKGFIDWLLSSGADVVCIQETKANPGQLSAELLAPGGVYKSWFSSAKKPGYSGTAIFAKKMNQTVLS